MYRSFDADVIVKVVFYMFQLIIAPGKNAIHLFFFIYNLHYVDLKENVNLTRSALQMKSADVFFLFCFQNEK